MRTSVYVAGLGFTALMIVPGGAPFAMQGFTAMVIQMLSVMNVTQDVSKLGLAPLHVIRAQLGSIHTQIRVVTIVVQANTVRVLRATAQIAPLESIVMLGLRVGV